MVTATSEREEEDPRQAEEARNCHVFIQSVFEVARKRAGWVRAREYVAPKNCHPERSRDSRVKSLRSRRTLHLVTNLRCVREFSPC